MARGVKLVLAQLEKANHYFLRCFRLQVTATEVYDGMDPNVFLFRRSPPDPVSGEVYDKFVTVCSPVDMSDWPVGEPNPFLAEPFFRNNTVALDVRSLRDFNFIWDVFRREVGNLCVALDRLDQLVDAEFQWVGTPPPGDNNSLSYSEPLSESA